MSQEQATFSFNEELDDNTSDKVCIQLSTEVININYYQLFKWSKLVRDEYPKNEISRLSSYICQMQQQYNIKQENIKSFLNSISIEQIQITIDQYFDYLKLSKILNVEMISRILQKFAQNHCNDVIFIRKNIHDQLSSQKNGFEMISYLLFYPKWKKF
ncbi:hypothetical protein M9Y10_003713 [Tritrichomonas musculus]|uniref:Uncharacterized protein n=1 Tax=Tritrichomonas musculus TaxID=1915356 RepID=A0ABR2JQP0_9EUKA